MPLRANLQSARRGAVAGPSGATAEYLRVLLDDEDCCDLLVTAAQRLAQADVPDDVAAGLCLGRMVALLKPSGGICDVFRRLVSRTLAQQFSTPLQEACAPYQYALSTRAGAEALARALRGATGMSTSTPVVSVDGIGALDHISRKCIFDGHPQRWHPLSRPPFSTAAMFFMTRRALPTLFCRGRLSAGGRGPCAGQSGSTRGTPETVPGAVGRPEVSPGGAGG